MTRLTRSTFVSALGACALAGLFSIPVTTEQASVVTVHGPSSQPVAGSTLPGSSALVPAAVPLSTGPATQAQLAQAQHQLASLNATLAALTRDQAANQTAIVQAKAQLASLLQETYVSSSSTGLVTAILDAKTFSGALDQVQGNQHFMLQIRSLESQLSSDQAAVLKEQAAVKAQFAKAQALQTELSQENAVVVQVVHGGGTVGAISPYSSFSGGHGWPDHFAFGECTWYVAQMRYIPWFGNANQWYGAAAAMGYPEGHMPEAGAVVVFWPGGDGADTYYGHVAYVEAVGPTSNIPAGEFELSEMNFGEWDHVDTRILPDGSSGIQGFIYSK